MMRRALRWSLAALVALLLPVVIALLALRLMLPHWEGLAGQIEQRASMALEREVRIGSLQIGWSGWVPELVALGVRIEAPGTMPLTASELGFSLDPLRSLRARGPVLREARLSGVSLHLVRDADGVLDLHGWRFGGGGTVAVDWRRHFAGMERLRITEGTLQWEDALTGVRTGLFVDSFGLRADATGLRMAGDGSFLPEAGGPVYVGIMVPPDGPDRLDFYIEAEDLQWPYWARLTGALGRGPLGTSSLRLWADLESGRVQRLQGEHLSHFILDASEAPRIQELGHRFRWQRRGARSESHWSATTPGAGDLRLAYDASIPDGPPDHVTVAVADADLAVLLRPLEGLRLRDAAAFDPRSLAAAEPVGRLEQAYLELRYRELGDGESGWRVDVADASLLGVGLTAVGQWPALAGLDVSLRWQGEQAELWLDSNDLEVDLPQLFADPLWAARLHARAAIERGRDGWGIEIREFELANPDAAVEGRGRIDFGTEPRLDLTLDILRADGSRVAPYLPVRRLPENTYRWLVESIRGGTVTGGSMWFRGNPSDFPFDDGQGLFQLWATVEQGWLEYQPGWPAAHELSGTLIFQNAGFRAEQASGRIFDTEISDTVVTVANMREQPELEIRGRARGSLQDLKVYLEQADVAGGFAPLLAGVQPGGDGDLDLDLSIPLQAGAAERLRVAGRLQVRDGALVLPELGLRLRAIGGELRFDPERGVRGRGIRAQVHDEPVLFDVQRDAAGRQTRIQAHGRQPLAPWIGERPELLNGVRGMPHWQADILIDAAGDSRVALFTDLEGVQLDWPPPLAKTRGTRRPLHINWPLGQPAGSRGRINFDDVLVADVRLAAGPAPDSGTALGPGAVQAAALALGRQRPVLPALPEQGVDLRARLEWPDVESWQRLLQALVPTQPQAARTTGDLHVVHAELDILEGLRWREHAFPGLRLRMEQAAHGRRLEIDADWLQGRAWSAWPQSPEDASPPRWYVHLDRLQLGEWQGAADRTEPASDSGFTDPRAWPGVQLRVTELQLGRLQLAGLELDLEPSAQGLEVSRLRAISPKDGVIVQGDGHWRVTADELAESQLTAEIIGRNWGRGLGSMGVSAALEQGEGTGRIDLSWPGALYAPEIGRLQGRVRVDVREGVLREVDPGAGRLLGLVSLDLVPRRLRLDFRDVYTQGLAFDRLAGEAVLEGGDLLLPELRIQSPSAVVRVSGRTGLVARDFDQSIVVVPRLRSTLPIAGALLGGPVTGVVVLLVERVLGIGDQVEEAARVEYFVTGPWSNPEVRARVRTEQGFSD